MGEAWKNKSAEIATPVKGGGLDPRGNISRITSARFVGEILITFPRHWDGESLRLINIFTDIIKYDSGRGWSNSIMFSIRDTRMIEIFFRGAGKI